MISFLDNRSAVCRRHRLTLKFTLILYTSYLILIPLTSYLRLRTLYFHCTYFMFMYFIPYALYLNSSFVLYTLYLRRPFLLYTLYSRRPFLLYTLYSILRGACFSMFSILFRLRFSCAPASAPVRVRLPARVRSWSVGPSGGPFSTPPGLHV